MWITRCLPVCRGAIASHPLTVGIPAAVSTIGVGAALAVMLSAPPPKPQLPCGCHQVWVAPVLPMTPQDYRQAIRTAGDVAFAGIPLADAPGGSVYGTPASVVPGNVLPADFLVSKPGHGDTGQPSIVSPLQPPISPVAPTPVPTPVPSPVPSPVSVPEPASLAVFATALAALVRCRRSVRGRS